MSESAPKPPPPWLFAISGIPYGVVGSFAGPVMSYLAQEAGRDLDSIGWYQALLMFPPMMQFLYAPIVDVGPKRKHWLIILASLASIALVAACVTPIGTHPTAFLAFAVTAQLLSGLTGSCNGGLLAVTMPDHLRGRASAWLNIGNLSGGAVSAAIAIWMTGRVDPLLIGLTLAGMMVLSSLAILKVVEPPRDNIPALRDVFTTTLRDVRRVLFSRAGATGFLLCMSPVGTAALTNFFGGMNKAYGASQDVAGFVNGPANAVLTAIGAFVGGVLCDRYNRRAMYLLSGTLTALCGIAMASSPRSEMTYAWGVMLYMLITGFCYSAFTATVLETIGKGGKAASTQYALFVAAGNGAINYVGFADTRFGGSAENVSRVISADALLNIGGVIVLGLVFWKLGSFGKWRHSKELDEPAGPAEPDPLPRATASERDH